VRAFALAFLAALAAAAQSPPQTLRSGIEFQSADVRALQADDFANPAQLWVDKGSRLWGATPEAGGPSCAACHGEARATMKGAAARYPRFDAALGRVVNVEGRINACVVANQGAKPWAFESEELLALTSLVASASRGVPMSVAIDGRAAATYERGRTIYATRMGQLNLACTHCHDAKWGRTILAEPISQGHPTGWPAYRLEWQAVGSLERRLRACYYGVRAEQPAYGSEDFLALELYLANRARGLAVEAPGVRR
jgi:L-cysteine S-thiosulfotransferase